MDGLKSAFDAVRKLCLLNRGRGHLPVTGGESTVSRMVFREEVDREGRFSSQLGV